MTKSSKTTETLVADIYAVLESTTDHTVDEDNVEWAGEVFKDLLRHRFKKREKKEGDAVLRFSSLGKQSRQLWYEANHPDEGEEFSGKHILKFLYGDLIEVLLLFLAKESGHEVTHLQHEVEVDGVRGHMDAVIDGVPVDVKSASEYSFRKFADGSFVFDDPFGYQQQLSGYAHAVGSTDEAGFLVADKVHGDLCFAKLDGQTIEAFPPGPRIAQLREELASDTPPPRCYPDEAEGKSGNRKLGVNCSYCKFKDLCWADANGGKGLRKFIYARKPVWLTHVEKEPRVEEV